MTIPTLIVSNQEKGWNTASKVFEAKLEQALKVMNTQQTLAGYRTTKDFVNELRNHLKIVKICDSDKLVECFEDKVIWGTDNEEVDMSEIKTAKNFGQDDWDTETVGIQLANGSTAVVAYNPACRQDPYSNQVVGTSCLAVLYDTSGFTKPNTQGKDLSAINVNKLAGKCAFKINGTCYGTPFYPTPMTMAECKAEKNNLGIKYCFTDSNYDYWGGAVKQCGGVGNMPTKQQVIQIAEEIYGQKINTFGITYGKRNDAKLKEYGFNILPNGSYSLWADEEDISVWSDGVARPAANHITFHQTYAHYEEPFGNMRFSSQGIQAVCIIN